MQLGLCINYRKVTKNTSYAHALPPFFSSMIDENLHLSQIYVGSWRLVTSLIRVVKKV